MEEDNADIIAFKKFKRNLKIINLIIIIVVALVLLALVLWQA